MNAKKIDKLIILVYFLSIALSLYYYGLSQSIGHMDIMAPIGILLLPFGVAVLQLVRISSTLCKYKINVLGRVWLWIFIYYLWAFIIGFTYGHTTYNYNTYWFVFCPPVAWVYFSLVLKETPSLSKYLVKLSFGLLILYSAIFLYFVPKSIHATGYFASLNTGYYALMIYPLSMMNKSRMKQIVSTGLLLIVVLLSMKRGAVVSVSVAFILYFLLSSYKKLGKKIVAFATFALVVVYLFPRINEYSNGTLLHRYEFTQNQGDEDGRASMYPLVWSEIWSSSPTEVIFGHGHNAIISNNVLQGLSAHNDYLEFFYDYGILGLLLLLLYQFQLFRITKISHRLKTDFLPTIFALTSIVVLSMVSIVYAYNYFLIIIPFWSLMMNRLETNTRNENRNINF